MKHFGPISLRKIIPLFLVCSISIMANSQDTLPDFSVSNKGPNRNLISWYNRFGLVKQISIQRSPDSLNNYKTILTVPDPMNRQNGFLDTKAAHDSMFYRLYILLDGGNFIFTKSQRPFHEKSIQEVLTKSITDSASLTPEELVILKRYRESLQERQRDTLAGQVNGVLRDKNKTNLFVPSYRISTNREGNVRIRLHDYETKQYSIRFYEDDETFLFELKTIKQATFTLDKSNFHHSGWFRFELYDSEKLVEKHKFFIPKDF